MRRQQGRAARNQGAGGEAVVEKKAPLAEPETKAGAKEGSSPERAGETREQVFSWFEIVRSGAQLTLDVLRVVRETADLYRKLKR